MNCGVQYQRGTIGSMKHSTTVQSKYQKTGAKRQPDYVALVNRDPKLPPISVPYQPSKANPFVENRRLYDNTSSKKPYYEATEDFITSSRKFPEASRPRRDSFGSRSGSANSHKKYSTSTTFINASEINSFDRRRSESSDRLVTKVGGDSNNNYGYKSLDKKYNNNTPRSNRNGGLRGLRNLGNTCFMNSIIQCLSNTKLLRDYCLRYNYENDTNKRSSMKGKLIKAFSDLLKQLWSGDSSTAVSPKDFKDNIGRFSSRFDGYSQHDSQEFLLYLLEGLHTDLNSSREKEKPYIDCSDQVDNTPANEKSETMWKLYEKREKSKIVDIFVGQLQSSLRCDKCSYVSNTFEPLWMLHLPLTRQNSKLENCLSQFTKEEMLDRDEKPMCARCKSRQRSHKKFSIRRFPKVLIIQLKRFEHGRYVTSKLNYSINYPIKGLNMQGHASDGVAAPIYDLYAVSNHSGTPQYGHYTADALNSETDTWHHFNDTIVTPTHDTAAVTQNGYVLFYVSREKTEL